MQKGNIGVTTENIFPVIKKFLYSDHEIFLREMVSNAVDATQKMKTLAERGDFKGELGDLTVRVSIDADKGTLTFSDRGIGMTAEEIDRYINQIAFSGVSDFLDKYKDNANAIIGHFELGFYSAFMVSKKVEIVTKSYREDATEVLSTKSQRQKKRVGEATSSYISMMTARSSLKRTKYKDCLTSIANSWLCPSHSERRPSGKMAK